MWYEKLSTNPRAIKNYNTHVLNLKLPVFPLCLWDLVSLWVFELVVMFNIGCDFFWMMLSEFSVVATFVVIVAPVRFHTRAKATTRVTPPPNSDKNRPNLTTKPKIHNNTRNVSLYHNHPKIWQRQPQSKATTKPKSHNQTKNSQPNHIISQEK